MTETLRQAGRNTEKVVELMDRAVAVLHGDGGRINGAGILANPFNTLQDMKAARDLLDRAIALHEGTNWLNASDYHAL